LRETERQGAYGEERAADAPQCLRGFEEWEQLGVLVPVCMPMSINTNAYIWSIQI